MSVPLLYALGDRLRSGPSLVRSPLLGKPAPTFALPRLDAEGTITSESLAGRRYVVNFWASWCVPCQEENPVLADFYQTAESAGVEVIGISYSDDANDSRRFRAAFGGGWPLLGDPKSRTAIDFGVFGVPETFIVDERGRIMAKFVGALSPGVLESALARLDSGEGPLSESNDRYRRSPSD
ncbi:MAG: TlpA family protein disulfide reductase [Acidimicrobiia bacterium]